MKLDHPSRELRMIRNRVAAVAMLLALAALMVGHGMLAANSQSNDQALQPGFNNVLVLVRHAEEAGATSAELAPLVAGLNKALEFNVKVSALNQPNETQSRQTVLGQLNGLLLGLGRNATQLESTASQRTFTNKATSYVGGGIGALIGAVLLGYCLAFWRKYRVKRTFEMRIIPK
jgi:hypothetical protein